MDKDVEMGVVNEDKASRPLLDTPEMAETQPDQEKPGLDSSQKVEPEEARKKKNQETTEKEINDALEKGNLKDIKKYVTPEKLTECTKNCIEKSFEVSHELKILGKSKRSEARKFNDFATQVEDFAYHMLEPLEKDDVKRAVFKEILFDDVSDKAIKLRQKKFVSHPVYSQMMRQRWNGDFYELKHCNVKKNLFKWALINFWTLFDMFLFPLAHILLWAINKISEFVKKEDTFLIFAFWEGMKKIRIVDDIMSSQAGDSPRRMEELEMCKNGEDVFLDYLEKAKKTFQKEKKKTNKVLVVMTDDKLIGSKRKDFLEAVRSLKKKQNVKVISVGLIYLAHLRHHCTHFEDLETMATNDENVFLTFERDDEMKDKILKCIAGKNIFGIAGKNIFERYVQYFKTPYFIFIRDTLSYLVLLGLHIAMCLQPSTLHFTAIEWIISVFFLGRFLTEMDLVIWEEEKEEKEEKEEEESKGSKSNAAEAKAGSKNEEEEDRLRKKLWKIISAYFDDWWNKIDIVTLIVFLVLIGFRIFTWSQHSSISKNRLLAFAGYLYGLNAMFLSLRVFGHIMENNKATGSIQIALFHVMGAILIILGQFLVSTLAFSLAITKIYIAEASYSSGRNETFSGVCKSQHGLKCWFIFIRHLAWSLLGFTDFTPLQSSDNTSDSLAKILYALFLIMGVVMLMNMMIALLSNTYQQVEDNAFYEWSYKKATTVITYTKYHSVPVPFNIISLSFILLRYLYRKINSCRKEKVPQVEKGVRVPKTEKEVRVQRTKKEEELFKQLKAEYLAKYGKAFPKTDKSEMASVFKETEGNRNMIGHIAQRVFRYDQKETQQLESHGVLSKWEVKGIAVTGQRLERAPCPECSKDSSGEKKWHTAKYLSPLCKEHPGFEVFVDCGSNRPLYLRCLLCPFQTT